jgi:hypothetical protein
VNRVLYEIAERIRGELDDLETTVHRAQGSWLVVQRHTVEQDVYLDSVALNLHSFYSGLERIFELIVRAVDQAIPSGETWHRELLEQVSHEIAGLRPAVINAENARRLEEFRRFRHLVRNVYAADLIPGRMANMLANLPGLWTDLRAELLAFADFLDQSSHGNIG